MTEQDNAANGEPGSGALIDHLVVFETISHAPATDRSVQARTSSSSRTSAAGRWARTWRRPSSHATE
jgi:hypothetical protein